MNTGPNRRDFLAQAVTLTTAGTLAAHAASAAAPEVQLAPPDRQPPELEVPTPVKRKVGWAIVGLGELALGEIMPAFAGCHHSEPVALVSGHPDKARKVAEAYGLSKDAIYSYENYDQLADNPRVEVIYIVLPNSMHAEYTIRGFRAGKHVLCEKPMAATSKEAASMIQAAKDADRKLMIGYRLHYEPFNRKVMELCRNKSLGEIKTFASSNCQNVKAPNIRLSASLAGGPLGDVGVYCINAARYVTGEEPVEVTATQYQPGDDPRFREVPESVAFTMRYPSGALAHCDCSFGTAESRRFRVNCAKGYIDLDPAFSYKGQRLHIQEGASRKKEVRLSQVLMEPVNHFAAEMDHFSSCILENKQPDTPGEMGLADMRIIEALQEAARTGRSIRTNL